MPHPIPLPGTSRARLIEAGIAHFEERGFDGASVHDIARAAGVTTGPLYHHFGSKLGLYAVIREEMERRMTERMAGAAAAMGGGRPGARAALVVAFDAAVRFNATRILSAPQPHPAPDPIALVLQEAVPEPPNASTCLAALWRGALAAVASGAQPAPVRTALEWVLGPDAAVVRSVR